MATDRSIVPDPQEGEAHAERESEASPVSLSEVAYHRILEMLFGRHLPAGAFVSQNELVRLVGVPVAPLRDALRVLQTEGVLTIHSRSGIRFLKPDFEFTKNTYQFRGILERPAVRVFAETAGADAIDAFVARHDRLIAAIGAAGLAGENVHEIIAIDADFHFAIVAALANPLVGSTYRRVHNYLQLIRLDRRLTAATALRTLNEHLDILAACRSRDIDAAEAALQLHFSQALQRALGIF